MSGEQTWSISELATEFDVTPRTIRHYENEGLLSPARAGQTRVYSKRDRTRLRLALRGRRLGLSLAEIKELIDLYDSAPDERAQLYKFLMALSKRRTHLERQRDDIEELLSEVTAFERQCRELIEKDGERLATRVQRRASRARSGA
jgi:DNA-binding transcriptional MerR regulator